MAVMSRDTGQSPVPNNAAGTVSEAAVLQTPAKLKIHSFHLTIEESSRIRRELEQQTLVFLATDHSHFWENKRIEDCCHFLVVCSYIFKDNFTWMVWEAGIGLHLRKHTTICRQVWKQKKPSSMADCLMPRNFCWAICFSRECLKSMCILMQDSC